MKKYILIEADTNDGDYVTKVSEITDEQIELIKPVIEAIKRKNASYDGGHNYETEELVGKSDAKKLYGHLEGFITFNGFVPEGDENYPGIHTIERIKIFQLLDNLL